MAVEWARFDSPSKSNLFVSARLKKAQGLKQNCTGFLKWNFISFLM
jgi:hypothetical protein